MGKHLPGPLVLFLVDLSVPESWHLMIISLKQERNRSSADEKPRSAAVQEGKAKSLLSASFALFLRTARDDPGKLA